MQSTLTATSIMPTTIPLALNREIHMIPAKIIRDQKAPNSRQLRVAGYCRVSTEQEEQQNSYEAQIGYYTNKIAGNPEWCLAGIYADEGITGTSAKKRPQFLKMIEHCKKGKIDVIITKSISRFSRNTVDCLQYIRLLKELKIPVIFEKECLNSMTMVNEMAITLMGCFAQAESESISQNVKMGKRYRYRDGKVSYVRIYGYKIENKVPVIIPDEAEVVKRIYASFLAGDSIAGIKKSLEADGVKAAFGKGTWSHNAITTILRNEKYIGDVLLQKTYIEDVITRKCRKNNGELPQVLVKNAHTPIIERDIFGRVQEEFARRNSKRKVSDKTSTEQSRYSSKYALTEILICGNCGTPYKRVTWSKQGNKKIVWRCISRLDYGTKYCKDSPTIEEYRLHNAIMAAVNTVAQNKDDVCAVLQQNIQSVLSGNQNGESIVDMRKKLNEIVNSIKGLLENSGDTEYELLENRIKALSDERKVLADKILVSERQSAAAGNSASKMAEISEWLDSATVDLEEYDDRLIRRSIDTVKVISAEKILVIFKSGHEIEQPL